MVDTSVALKWVLSEPGSDEAEALLLRATLIAPPLMHIEAANAIWSKFARGEISLELAQSHLAAIRTAPVALSEDAQDLPMALRLAAQLTHPVYDCVYVAVAIREDLEVVTADQRFLRAVASDPALAARVRPLV